jgi:hypothetical protein
MCMLLDLRYTMPLRLRRDCTVPPGRVSRLFTKMMRMKLQQLRILPIVVASSFQNLNTEKQSLLMVYGHRSMLSKVFTW